MKIMVIGAGVAGSACAIGLRRLGADVTVYEASHDPAGSVGSFLSLAGNGLRGLHALGCLQPVQQVGFEVPRQRMWSSSGKLLGDVPRGRLSGDPLNSITLLRGRLVEQLRAEAQRAGAQLVTGRDLIDAVVTDRAVRAEFDDGSGAEADLLIGADGIWSVTRRILDPAAPNPAYAGLYTVSGSSDAGAVGRAIEAGVFNMVFARRGAFIYLAADDGSIWWSAQVASPDEPETGTEPADLAVLFRYEALPTSILRAATSAHRATLHHVLGDIPVWHNDRIALVGDAAHPVGAGQGASMSIEDAVVLADHLGSIGATSPGSARLGSALAGYTQARRTRTAKMIKAARANRDSKTAGPIGRRVNDLVMPIVFRHFYERATAWLYADPDPKPRIPA